MLETSREFVGFLSGPLYGFLCADQLVICNALSAYLCVFFVCLFAGTVASWAISESIVNQ